MPHFATCTIANAILALLRVASRPDFFVMGLCCPFALRYAGQLQVGAQDCWCLLPRAAYLSPGAMLAVLRACSRSGLPRPCGGSCGRATSLVICHGSHTVHADHFMAQRLPSNRVRTACVTFAPWPQGSASRRGLSLPTSTLHTIALQIHNNLGAWTCSCKIGRLISFAGHALTSSTTFR